MWCQSVSKLVILCSFTCYIFSHPVFVIQAIVFYNFTWSLSIGFFMLLSIPICSLALYNSHSFLPYRHSLHLYTMECERRLCGIHHGSSSSVCSPSPTLSVSSRTSITPPTARWRNWRNIGWRRGAVSLERERENGGLDL